MAGIYERLMDGMAGAQEGANVRKKQGLAALVGQAYNAPQEQRQALYGQIATLDPATAATTQKSMGEWDDTKQAALQRSAQMILAAPEESRPQLWARIVASGEIPGLSPQYDPIKVPEMAQKIVAMGGGQQEVRGLAMGNRIVHPVTGEVIYEGPEQQHPGQLANVPDGNGGFDQMIFDPRTRTFSKPQYPGAQQGAPQGADVMGDAYQGESDLSADVSGLVSPLGGRITSTTGGQHNVGSKHASGGAIDVGMGRESPEQQAQILAALQAKGLRVRDERTRPPGQKVWSGPHLHVERGQQVAQAGRMGHTPPKAKAASEQYRTLSAAEVKQAGLPAGTVAQVSPAGQVQIVNKPRDIPGAQSQVIENADGTQTIIPAGKTTEDQNKSAGWYASSQNALKNLRAVIAEDPSALFPGVIEAYAPGKEIQKRSMSPTRQRAAHAFNTMKMDFLHAATGAGFTKEEAIDEWENLAPQRGDGSPLVDQKLKQIEVKLAAMRQRAGGAVAQTQGAPSAGPRRLKFNPQTGRIE